MLWFSFTSLIFLLTGFFILYRVNECRRSDSISISIPGISIIIPARNEENTLPWLLNSLKSQTLLPDEIIVVDDNSEDRTALVAEEHGARLVSALSLPEGWQGKTWSCYRGAQEASQEIFIFLDADTFLEPDGLEKMAHTFIKSAGAISILPYHKIKKIHEAFSAFFNIMQLIGMNCFSISKGKNPAGMFGPCIIISRKDYMEIEGHKSVKGEVLEHYALSSVLQKHNIPVKLFIGRGSLNMRMYPEGWKALIQGWSKSFMSGANKTPGLVFRLSIMWISGLLITPVFLIFSIISLDTVWIVSWTIIYIFYVVQLLIQFRRAGCFPVWSAVLYPVNLLFFLAVFAYAGYMTSSSKNISWKGRKIKL